MVIWSKSLTLQMNLCEDHKGSGSGSRSLNMFMSKNRTWTLGFSFPKQVSVLLKLEQFSLHAFSQLSCFKETYLKFRTNIHLPKFILPGETLKTHPSHLLLLLLNRSNGILTHKRGREYNKNRECSKLNKFDFMEISLHFLCFAHFCCGSVKTSL